MSGKDPAEDRGLSPDGGTDGSPAKGGGAGSPRLHRRGFFTEGLRSILRPLAEVVEQRMQALDAAGLSDLMDDRSPWSAGTPSAPAYTPPPPPMHLRPPGALPEGEFLSRCVSSGACVAACPVSAIRLTWSSDPRLNGKPAVEPQVQACVLCAEESCMKACPSGALRPVPREEIRMGIAVPRREHCFRTSGEDCRICVDKCPVGRKAIDVPYPGAEVLVSDGACTGCGVCEMACPARPRAIVVEKLQEKLQE
jgi:MauM/NapG family ferredoxin protein